jgi:surfeit locus 1 family protein
VALAAAGCAAGIALGNWQSSRAGEKQSRAAMLEEAARATALAVPAAAVEPAHYLLKRVEARGEFAPQHTVLLVNKLRQGRVGYEVLTPLHLGAGRHVLVNRGWIAAYASLERLPEVRTPPGPQRIEGVAFERLPRRFNPGGHAEAGPVRQEVGLAAFSAETGLALQPFLIEQHSETDDGLLREWPRPQSGAQKHEMYALQWYALAALCVILLLVLSLRRADAATK